MRQLSKWQTLVFTIGWVPVFIVSAVFFLFWGILIGAVILRNRKSRRNG